MKTQEELNHTRIATAITFISKNYKRQPSLEEIAEHVHLSPFHFQRMFQQRVGVSPKQYVQYLSVGYAKKILKETHATLFDTAYEVGLSATSRLHDLFVNIEGMTPGEFKNGGKSLSISYSFSDTPFGIVIVASTEKGVCHMAFVTDGKAKALDELKSVFPNAQYKESSDRNQQKALSVFAQDWSQIDKIKLHLKGTEFQLKVWEALLRIPYGGLTTYSDLALKAGCKGAQRAVGTALGHNPVALLIPCHRVIKASGEFGNYHWGEEIKTTIIGWEAVKYNLATEDKRSI